MVCGPLPGVPPEFTWLLTHCTFLELYAPTAGSPFGSAPAGAAAMPTSRTAIPAPTLLMLFTRSPFRRHDDHRAVHRRRIGVGGRRVVDPRAVLVLELP